MTIEEIIERLAAMPCRNCQGCGRIANSEDGEPWVQWESLPEESQSAIKLGIVKPIECPDCNATGARVPWARRACPDCPQEDVANGGGCEDCGLLDGYVPQVLGNIHLEDVLKAHFALSSARKHWDTMSTALEVALVTGKDPVEAALRALDDMQEES